jgi:hypothetical protein
MNLFPFKDPSFNIQHSEKLQAPKIFKHPLRGQIKRDESLQYSMASRHDFGPWNLDHLWILDLGGWSFLRPLPQTRTVPIKGNVYEPVPI